ncbi:MAG: hypothetical protein KGP10_09050 [Actinomycetales bacterium]|nr:hypothetical protein [Actinomycetales bacterium]
MSTPAGGAVTLPRSPTTGEPMTTVARRSLGGLWCFLVMDVSGTLALVISYTYLWSLNVNNGWAPPGASLNASQTNAVPAKGTATFATEWPFWAILIGVTCAMLLMWWGYRQLLSGRPGALIGLGTLSLIVIVAMLVAQVWQMATFPFGTGNGAYASAVYALTASNVAHLLLVAFLALGIVLRTRAGVVSSAVPYQARLVTYWLMWVSIAFLLGALLTSFLLDSPNVNPTTFGFFTTQ